MLQAVSKNGQLVTLALLSKSKISQLKQENSPFYCPICKSKLVIKAGTKMIPHFAHRTTENCPNHVGGEGVYHERGKLDLFTLFKSLNLNVKLECFFPEIKQRADLLIQFKKKRLAIEYQCATIPVSEIVSRTKGYQSIGVTPLWILGGNRMRRLGKQGLFLTPTEQYFLHQFSNDPVAKIYFYCPNARQFARFDLACLTGYKRAIGKLEFYPSASIHLENFFEKKLINHLTHEWLLEKRRFRLNIPQKLNPREQKFREWLYINQLFPSLLSSWVGLPVNGQWKMKVSAWTWQTYLCYDFLNHFPQFTVNQLNRYMRTFINHQDQYPLLQQVVDPISDYLAYFIKLGKMTRIDDQYIFHGSINQHTSIEEALRSDRLLHNKLIE